MKCMTRAARLLVCVVPRGSGERVVAGARRAGARGGTIIPGRGTAASTLLRVLGLGETARELVFVGALPGAMQDIARALRESTDLCRKEPGIGFIMDVTSFLRPSASRTGTAHGGKAASGGERMEQTAHELVCAIVNAGLADDVMHAARKAGARGGTILRARGTATSEDSGFFGITIVPEKEVLMILASRGQSDAIADAVAGSECLAEPGSGVVFRMPVEEFFQLGWQNNRQ